MITNLFQHRISINSADDFLYTLLTENLMEIPVNLTTILQCIMISYTSQFLVINVLYRKENK